MRHIIQKSINDCGIACICMLLEHDLKMIVDYEEVKNSIIIEERGIRLDNLVDYLNNYDSYNAYKCEVNKLPLHPFITIIKNKKNLLHYIVVWKIEKNKVYYSNPNETKINKISLKKFKLFYNGIIVFAREEIINEPMKNRKLKIKEQKKYLLPLILINILEIIIYGLSLLYLFNINEFKIVKLLFFLFILSFQIIIYLLKNFIINKINLIFDEYLLSNELLELNNKKYIKETIQKSYYYKHKKNLLYNKIIPYLIIIVISFLVFFYLHYLFFGCMFVFVILFYYIESFYFKKRDLRRNKCLYYESEFDNNIKDNLSNLRIEVKKLEKIVVSESIINVFYRQIMLIFVMLFFSFIKQENFVFIGIYLCFYIFEGVMFLAEYRADKEKYNYISYNLGKTH